MRTLLKMMQFLAVGAILAGAKVSAEWMTVLDFSRMEEPLLYCVLFWARWAAIVGTIVWCVAAAFEVILGKFPEKNPQEPKGGKRFKKFPAVAGKLTLTIIPINLP